MFLCSVDYYSHCTHSTSVHILVLVKPLVLRCSRSDAVLVYELMKKVRPVASSEAQGRVYRLSLTLLPVPHDLTNSRPHFGWLRSLHSAAFAHLLTKNMRSDRWGAAQSAMTFTLALYFYNHRLHLFISQNLIFSMWAQSLFLNLCFIVTLTSFWSTTRSGSLGFMHHIFQRESNTDTIFLMHVTGFSVNQWINVFI